MDDTSSTTSAFLDRSLEAALDALGEAGFPQAEIWVSDSHMGPPGKQELSRLRGILEAHSVRGRTMHAPVGRVTLAAMDASWRKESVGVLTEYIRLAGDLSFTELVVHPISRDMVPYADDPSLPQRMREAVRLSLDDLMPVIEDSGVRITLENLPVPTLPLNSMRELRTLVDPYPSEAVGLVIDLGHVARLDLDPVDEIHAAGERLYGTHIHDINVREGGADHYSPTLGNLEWDAVRQAFTEIGYTGPWTSEATKSSHGESPEELAREVKDWMTSWLR